MSSLRSFALLGMLALLAGCPKKDDSAGHDAAPTAATATTSSSTPTAAASDTTAPTAAQAMATPPSGAPEVVDDPNAPPNHDEHDKAATAAIQKNNYKSELDKLEKEDLNSQK